MKYVHGQIIVFSLQALYRHAEVVSGAYKFRKTHRGVNAEDEEMYREQGLLIEEGDPDFDPAHTFKFRRLTDEEKLKDTLATMQRHIQFVSECIEHLSNDPPSAPKPAPTPATTGRRRLPRCPRCSSCDILGDASQSFDCYNCGHSW